jgi:hypothetical protein
MHMRGLRPSVEDRRKTTSLRQMQNTVLGSKIEMSDFSIYEVIRRRELSRGASPPQLLCEDRTGRVWALLGTIGARQHLVLRSSRDHFPRKVAQAARNC